MADVHQLLATFSRNDAIGEHAIRIQAALSETGIGGTIHAATLNPGTRRLGHPLNGFQPAPDDLVVYHASIGSPVADVVLGLSNDIILDYHNITPAHFFSRWEPVVERELMLGRRQLRKLSIAARIGLADSGFNAGELTDSGCSHTAVVPILMDLDNTTEPTDTAINEIRNRHTGPHWLFVGRLAPNKAQHDLIAALALYRQHIDPTAHLTLIGNTSSPKYATALKRLAHHLDCTNNITFTGPVDDHTLAAHYRAADLFICLSDHEGFCVPLLEAMHHQTPIIAYDSTAIAETLGTAGLLLPDKRPLTVATTAHHLHTNPTLQHTLNTNAKQQLTKHHPTTTHQHLLNTLTPHLT